MANEKLIPFLKKLKANNHKEWFDLNRKEYDAVREELISTVDNILKKMAKFESFAEKQEAKKCMFRINRDIRFAKDKTPYKINMGASFTDGGKKSPKGGYYLHIEPGNSFLAGGIWQPETDTLKKLRQEIDYNGAELKKIIKAKDFKTFFGELDREGELKKLPKDFEEGHQHTDLLKLKSFIVVHPFKDKEVSSKDFPEYAAKVFKAIYPLNKFLNQVFE